jgi:hypothetical protein
MPRKAAQAPYDGPPGPQRIEVRINGRIVLACPMFDYDIDQQDAQANITVHTWPREESKAAPFVTEEPLEP